MADLFKINDFQKG